MEWTTVSIHTMDGYDFERLITQLLKNMDFSVEMTSLSGDGGVDIIAYSNAAIFKGKYLVQCKRWNSAVGEPAVRDLYGVVLSENANKGIIITNSSFSKKAIEFADGKNLELIDGTTLAKLLKQYNLDATNETARDHRKSSFYEMDNFESDKYLYLKSRIEGNRNEKQNYDSLRKFLHSYIARNEIEINKNGLIDEYIQLNNEYIKRFCKKSKINLMEKEVTSYMNGMLYLLKGEVFKAIEIFKEDLNLLNTKRLNILLFDYSLNSYCDGEEYGNTVGEFVERIRDGYSTYNIRKSLNQSPELMIINIYLIFFKLNYIEGLNSIVSHVNSLNEMAQNGNHFTAAGKYRLNLLFQDIKVTLKEISQNTYNRLYIPIDLDYKLKKDVNKQYYYELKFDEEAYVSVDELFNQYWDNRSLEQEIKHLEILYK